MIITSIPDYDSIKRNGKTPENNSSRAPDEWLTIAEAARRLGIDPRQARRYADRLDQKDRTHVRQRPARVRFEAVARLWEESRQGQMRLEGQSPDSADLVPATVTLSVEQVSALYETVIAEKDARIKALEAALDFAQEAARTTIRALPPAVEDTSMPPKQTSAHRPWWRFFRRS